MNTKTDEPQTTSAFSTAYGVPRVAVGGLLVRKEAWRLSSRAWVLALLILAGGIFATVRCVYPFLAVTDEPQGELLVVEGWVPKYVLADTALLCRTIDYKRIVTSGCMSVEDLDDLPNQNYADFAARRLRRMGMTNSIQAVHAAMIQRDRTYNSAVAVEQWMQKNGVHPSSIDVVTVGPHARRSRLMYEKAFGKGTKINIIPFPEADYDAEHWWRSSEGFKDVLGESISYLYACFLFHPPTP